MSNSIKFEVSRDFDSVKNFIRAVATFMSELYVDCGFDLELPINNIKPILESNSKYALLIEPIDELIEECGLSEFSIDDLVECLEFIDTSISDDYQMQDLVINLVAEVIVSESKLFKKFEKCVSNISRDVSESYSDSSSLAELSDFLV